jgi:Kef-type K+ transport system membrane component KefB
MTTDAVVAHVAAAIAVIIVVSVLLGRLAQRVGQPPVIGQILGGILLGPSALGQLPGDLDGSLFPAAIRSPLAAVAQLALVLYLFSIAHGIDRSILRRHRRVLPFVTVGGFAVPMALGAGSVLLFGSLYSVPAGGPAGSFVLYIGVAMSITAVPVLVRIMAERRISDTTAGVVALAAASLIDVFGWIVLSAVLIGAGTAGRPWSETLGLFVVYVLVTVLVVRPGLQAWMHSGDRDPVRYVPAAAALALGSAAVTAALGLHVIFGALLAGLAMPRQADGTGYEEVLRPMRDAGLLLLPVFFTTAGLSVDVGGLHRSDLVLLLLVCTVAMLGKLVAGALAARAGRLSWRDSATVGILLNTRGLTELIVLNVGLEAGIIGERLYTVFVLMALLTTAAAGPLLSLLTRARTRPEPTPAQPAVAG